ncbi:Probable RNA-directed DNA polymerase from transposon BS [Eumeta japonica]|uniref:Probable RNA-directed DNA polymerase from transposon BS n=1 Tax=Eumeta variegata TaxID=151549 RepID=A0A4C1ZKX5_EUMVA|nr:Probable RNA-directed DNA polymerase from transposon BS [Eumeta japonica]
MEEIAPSHKAFWKVTKALKSEGYIPIPPLKKSDNSVALDAVEIAECLADSIETQCSHASLPHDIAHVNSIEEEQDVMTPAEQQAEQQAEAQARAEAQPQSPTWTLLAVRERLQALAVARAREGDGEGRDGGAGGSGGGGRRWWRGARVLKTLLSDHLLGKGLIIDEQFGFRPAHSCPQQVLRLVEYATEAFKRKHKTVAVFFDVAKAFDRVWHAGLIYKLYTLQIPDRLVLTIQNYLANRYFTFRHERTHSTRRLIRAGVPQGSSLSPLLYSAYTNDIPRPSSGVQLALFADDTALFYRNRYRESIARYLQRAVDELGQWFRLWRI